MPEGFKILDAYVEVTASGKGVADGVAEDIRRESSGRLSRTGSGMGGNLLGGLKGAFTSGAVGGLVGGVVGGVTSGLTSLIGTAVSDIGGMLVTVGGQIASTVIDFNSQLQNSTIGFETMLGSGVKAKSFMDDLQNFAKTTPFEFTSLVSNAQLMMGMGIAAKDVIPDLTALGDSVAAMGGSADQVNSVTLAFSQMVSKGTLDMGNMTQLLQGGVPSALKVMAASYGITTGKMIENISAGKVLASDALPRLVKGLENGTKATRGLGGMMDKQSQTFSGALSNIQDAFTQTTAKAFKPFFDAASNGMQRFAKALSGKPAEKFQKDVTKTLQPFAKEIEKWFKGIDFNKMFTGASKGFKDLAKGINPKDLGKALKGFGDDVGEVFRDIVKIAPKVGKAFKDIGPQIKPTIKTLVDLVGAASDLIDWFDKSGKSYTKFHDVNKSFKKDAKDLADFFSDRSRSIQKSFDELASFFSARGRSIHLTFSQIGSFIADRVASIRRSFAQIASFFADRVASVKKSGEQLVGFFAGLPAAFGTIGRQMVDGLTNGLRSAWGGLVGTLHDLAMKLPEPVRKALHIASPSKVFHLIGQQVGQGLHRGLLGSVDQIKTTSGKLADAVKETFSGHLETTMVRRINRIGKALEGLSARREKATERLADARSHLTDVLTARKDFASNVKSNVMGNADVSSIFMDSPIVTAAKAGTLNGVAYQPSWTTTAHTGLTAVKASLKKLLADTKKFSSNLARLAKMGIDPYTYDELVQAGVRGGGLETSDAFVKDPKLAKQIFTLERQVATAGKNLGNRAATHEYAGQVASARAAVRHDERVVHNYNVHMVVEAKKIDEVAKLVRMVEHVKATARKKKGKHR